METKIIAYVLIGVFLGPVASLAITPVFCLLRKIFFVPFICESLREEAERKGHVVQATLIKSHDIRNNDTRGRTTRLLSSMGTYRYQVNGRNYTYRAISEGRSPRTLTLYYIKKPRKATVSNDLGNWESPWLKFYLIISLLVTIATVVIGMMIG